VDEGEDLEMTHIRTAVVAALTVLVTSCGSGPAVESPQPAPSTPAPTSAGDPSEASAPTADPSAETASGEAGPVWWDEAGLHHGDVVETPAVPLEDAFTTRLALVRSGAVYRVDTGDVWFHPWGGTPRVVGHGTAAGPAGDPEGDAAAWFDGRTLVVYDTARDEVISRTVETASVDPRPEYAEHVGHGNGWVYVSSTQVVWRSPQGLARRDLVSGTSELPWRPRPSKRVAGDFVDVSAVSAVWVGGDAYEGHGTYLVEQAGSTDLLEVPELEMPGRLSPDGSWLLTAEIADGTHGVAITDLASGRVWKPFSKNTYAFFSWAYGDVVVMRTTRNGPSDAWSLTSCSASRRSCEQLDPHGEFALPTP
jgi:hypothetical protein